MVFKRYGESLLIHVSSQTRIQKTRVRVYYAVSCPEYTRPLRVEEPKFDIRSRLAKAFNRVFRNFVIDDENP